MKSILQLGNNQPQIFILLKSAVTDQSESDVKQKQTKGKFETASLTTALYRLKHVWYQCD